MNAKTENLLTFALLAAVCAVAIGAHMIEIQAGPRAPSADELQAKQLWNEYCRYNWEPKPTFCFKSASR